MPDELREVTFVGILIFVLQLAHVAANMFSEDVVTMNLGIEVVAFIIIARETLVAARNEMGYVYQNTTSSKVLNTSAKGCTVQYVHQRFLRARAHLTFAFFLSTPSESCLLLALQYFFVYMS